MITYVTAEQLGTCPAAVMMDDGTIQVNRDVWYRYSPFEQRFIIEHERGHYMLQTSSEEQADRYALRQVYGTAPQSLKQSIGTLVKMGNAIPSGRVQALYAEALKIDATANNNHRATQELKILTKQQPTMRASKYNQYHRADGLAEVVADTKAIETETETKQPSGLIYIDTIGCRPGVHIGQTFLDLQTLLMMAILILLCMIYKKK